MSESNSVPQEIHQLCVDVAVIKTMLEERKEDQGDAEKRLDNLERDIDNLKKFQWKLAGAILLIAVLLEGAILWYTRHPYSP